MPEIKIKTEFKTGTFVYLITDPYQYKRMVISIKYMIGGGILYGLCMGECEVTEHYAEELSTTEDVLFKQQNEDKE